MARWYPIYRAPRDGRDILVRRRPKVRSNGRQRRYEEHVVHWVQPNGGVRKAWVSRTVPSYYLRDDQIAGYRPVSANHPRPLARQ